MKLALKSPAEAVALLVEYAGGKTTAAEEAQRIRDGRKLAAEDFRRLGFERYYIESEAVKYDLLDWHLNTERWQFDLRCLPYLARPGKLLDFGAGIGLTAAAYASEGLEVTAVEASLDSDTVRFARFLLDRLGIEGVHYTAELPEEQFDNVVAIDVLEHLPDWTETGRSLLRLLRPGGTYVMTAPFADERDDPNHPQHFPSPVPVVPFLESLGLDQLTSCIWRKR